MAGPSVERDWTYESRVVSVVGTALAFVGLSLVACFLWLPDALSDVLTLESLAAPVFPGCIALLGLCVLLAFSSSRSVAAAWLARVGLVIVLVACASVLLDVSGTPLGFLDGAFTLWTTQDGVWPQAQSEIWIAAGAIVVLLASFRGQIARSLAQWTSFVVIAVSLFASLVFVLGSGATMGVQLFAVLNTLVAQACAVSSLHLVSSGDGHASRRLLLVTATSLMLVPAAAVALRGLVDETGVVITALLLVSVTVAVTAFAVFALRWRELALKETVHELVIARDDGDQVESAGGYGSWKLDTVRDVLVLSTQAGQILRANSLRCFADSIADGTHPEDTAEIAAWLEEVRSSPGSHCVTVRNVHNGDVRWIELCALRSHQDEYPIVHGTVRDVTEVRNVADKQGRELELLRTLASKVPDIDYIYDASTDEYVYVNRPIGDLLGYLGSATMTELEEYVAEEDKESLRSHLQAVNASDDDEVHMMEFRAHRADGGKAWLRIRASVFLRDDSGNPALIYGTLQDITERRELVIRLQESEARYERISDRAPGAIYQFAVSAEGELSIPYMSKGSIDVFGVTREEAQAKPMMVMGMVHEDDRAAVMEAIETSRQALSDFSWVGRINKPDGNVGWIRVASRPMRHEDGSTVWDGVVIDVTEEHVVQQALQKTKERLDYLLAESPTVVYECDPVAPYRVLSVAPNVRSLLGYVPEQVVGRPLFGVEFVHESDRDLFRAHERRFVDHGSSTAEYRLRTISGDYAWVRDNVRIVSSGGAGADMVGSWTDVSAQRSSMEKTIESEARLQRLASRVPGMVFELVMQDEVRPQFSYVSSGSYDLFKLPPEEVRARPESFLRMIDDQDRARLYRDLVRTQRDLSDLVWEGAIAMHDGRKKWVRVTARPNETVAGSVSWAGVATDVTELRAAQESLSDGEMRYAALVNSSSEVIITVDEGGLIVSANPMAERTFGYLSHELIGQPLSLLAAKGHASPLAFDLTDTGTQKRLGATKRDGTVFVVEVTVAAGDSGGRRLVTGIMSVEAPPPGRPRASGSPDQSVVAVRQPEREPGGREAPIAAPVEQTVLLIAPEHEIERLRGPDLEMSGVAVSFATTAGLGLEMAKRSLPSAIVLVEGLPDTGVINALEAIRADDDLRAIPVVVIGAPADRRERLLRSGATAVVDRSDARRSIMEIALQGSFG